MIIEDSELNYRNNYRKNHNGCACLNTFIGITAFCGRPKASQTMQSGHITIICGGLVREKIPHIFSGHKHLWPPSRPEKARHKMCAYAIKQI
jgi:hypothetical protein